MQMSISQTKVLLRRAFDSHDLMLARTAQTDYVGT